MSAVRHELSCREIVEATIRVAGSIGPEALSPEFRAGLIAAFRGFERPPREELP